MDSFVIIAVIFVFIALIVVGVVLVFLGKKRSEQKKAPVIRVEAKITRLFTQTKMVNKNFSSQTVDQTSGYEMTSYFVEFKPKNEKKVTFSLKKKIWLTLHENDQGFLVYKGYQLMSFTSHQLSVEKIENDYFRFEDSNEGDTIDFYGESSLLNIAVPSNQMIKINIKGLSRLISNLKNDSSDWFFVISKNKDDYMQVEKEDQKMIKLTFNLNDKEIILKENQLIDEIKNYMEV